MTTPQKPSMPSASLYVGDLHKDVTEAFLYDLFKEVGSIISIRVCRDAMTRESLGYAYVNFSNTQDAERAMETLNYTVINDKPIRIMWSQRDPSLRKTGLGNIFIRNLDTGIDNKALRDTFSAFGKILSCKVQHKEGRETGVGYVHFATKESADKAIEKVNGMLLNGTVVSVMHYKKGKGKKVDESNFTNCYVKNLKKDVDDKLLHEVFSKFGDVQNAAVMMDKKGEESLGFGFVNYKTHFGAEKACEELNGKEHALSIPKKPLFVGRALSKNERSKILRQRYQKEGPPIYKQQGTNLYIKHLDENIDSQALRKMFEDFGEIQSAVVMFDEKNGSSKGFGFVNYKSSEDASKAITEMNDKMVGSKPLYVALAQPKEVRKQQMRQKFQPIQGPIFFPPNQIPVNQQGQFGFHPGNPQQPSGFGGRPLPQHPHPQDFNNFPNRQSGKIDSLPTLEALRRLGKKEQKEQLGEFLFPNVMGILGNYVSQDDCGKITGMLIDMKLNDLHQLMSTPEALKIKVTEAANLLRSQKE